MLKYKQFSHRNKRSRKYNVYVCSCGKEKTIREDLVKSGKQKSCGCSRKKMKNTLSHGMSRTKIYSVWSSLKSRCLNPNNPQYKDYGGRGIKVSDRWLSFENFFEDMGHPKKEGLTIDRIDNEDGYYKENCRWATSKQQNSNKRSNKRYFDGEEELTLKQLSEKYNIKYTTLSMRINGYGWELLKAINKKQK